MSYNVLAPSLVKNVDYVGVKEEHIAWENRLKQIQREIIICQPHILCLQELEDKSGLHEFLVAHGYQGELYIKPEPSRVDGPATYYDTKRFRRVKSFRVPYNYKKSATLEVVPQHHPKENKL